MGSEKESSALANRKLALLDAVLTMENEEDVKALEMAVQSVKEASRARQLIIGYRPSGTPVLKQRFLDKLRHTLHDIEQDEYISMQTFERRAADW